MEGRKKTRKISMCSYNIKSILPVLLIVSIIPLIVRLKVLPLSRISSLFKDGQNMHFDFFSYYKMVYFLALTTIGGIVFLYKYFYKRNVTIRKTNIYYPMIIYTIFVVLSTICATYKNEAIFGFMDRYEGVFVLVGYMVCLFLAINLIDDEKQVKYMLFALGMSSILMSVIGIFQFLGKDIFATTFGKKIIMPKEYIHMIDSLKFTFNEGKTIYGTLFNPNYIGVYMSVIFSLSSTIFLLSRDKIIKIFFGTVSLLSFINLLGSGSRTSMINTGLYLILLIIFFRGLIFKRWKAGIVVICILSMILYGINHYTNGYIKERLISIKKSMSETEGNNFKDIILDGNEATIIVEDYEIKIIYEDGDFSFNDIDGNNLETIEKDNRITFREEPYSKHFFDRAFYNDGMALMCGIRTNKEWVRFNLVVDSNECLKFLSDAGEMIDLKNVPSWGFKGKEKFASNRGYIWSRSIPLLKDTIILGYGPDTYALHFPQDDYLGKLQGIGTASIQVDKPHNLFLQIAINTGVISLISLLVLFIIYIISSIKTYINRKEYNTFFEIAGLSIFFAICSYFMLGLLNDSVISVAPIFWILLGVGISINMKLNTDI